MNGAHQVGSREFKRNGLLDNARKGHSMYTRMFRWALLMTSLMSVRVKVKAVRAILERIARQNVL